MKAPFDDEATRPRTNERLVRIAQILAAAVLRLQSRAALVVSPETPPSLPNSENSERVCLDVSGKTGLSGHKG
jgi:hypothetical protein